VKIYPLIPVVLAAAAFGQNPPPKPSAPPSLAAPSPQAAPPANGPLGAVADPNKVIATIGDEKMTVAQFDTIVSGLPEQYQAQVRGPGKRLFIQQYIMIKALSQKALAMHLDQLPSTQQQFAFLKENILANLAGKAILDNTKVDNAALHKYYDEHKSDYQSVSAHHILIRFKGSPVPLKEGQKDLTEDEALAKAQELVKALKGGADFGAVAKAESADVGSAAQGGDLGASFKHGQMVKPFEDAAFALPPGQISDPVKSQFGYHIIRVDKVDFKSFDEARTEMEAKVKPEMAKKQMDEIQAAFPVKLDDSFFGPATPPTPPPGAVVLPQGK
jgi:peptidyl-prolyl cis-trans isomerase C